MGTLGVASAEAGTITPDSVNPAEHFTDCLGALFKDPAAHQQYCGPDSGGSGPPSTLAPTFSSPVVKTCTFVSLPAPPFATFKTALLDDLNLAGLGQRFIGQRVATGYGCCVSSLPSLLFSTFDIASIDDRLGPVDFGQYVIGPRVANTDCCTGSLEHMSFSTFGVATIGDSLTIPSSALRNVDALAQLAC